MIISAAGCAAEGQTETVGDDLEKLIATARHIHGLAGDAHAINEEIRQAEAVRLYFCQQYREKSAWLPRI